MRIDNVEENKNILLSVTSVTLVLTLWGREGEVSTKWGYVPQIEIRSETINVAEVNLEKAGRGIITPKVITIRRLIRYWGHFWSLSQGIMGHIYNSKFLAWDCVGLKSACSLMWMVRGFSLDGRLQQLPSLIDSHKETVRENTTRVNNRLAAPLRPLYVPPYKYFSTITADV